MKKILVPAFINDTGTQFLEKQGYQVIPADESPETLLKYAPEVHGILTAYGQIDQAVFSAAPNLKVVAKYGVGIDNIDCAAAEEHGTFVVNTPGANANAVAEYTLAVILALARHLLPLDGLMKNLGWNKREAYVGSELSGKVLGIIGLGQIGRLVAQKAIHGFGLRVIGYDAYADRSRLDPAITMCDDVVEVFRASDFLTLHAPVTTETYHLVNAGTLGMMKPTACLINAARGPLVDEDALYSALKNHQIRAAAVDAYAEEPLVTKIPLLELDNVITTPHIAFQTQEAMEQMSLLAAQGIDDVLSGRPPRHPVNSPRL